MIAIQFIRNDLNEDIFYFQVHEGGKNKNYYEAEIEKIQYTAKFLLKRKTYLKCKIKWSRVELFFKLLCAWEWKEKVLLWSWKSAQNITRLKKRHLNY